MCSGLCSQTFRAARFGVAATTVVVYLAAALVSSPADAQELDDVQFLVNPRLMIERQRTVSRAVRDAVNRRLADDPRERGVTGTVVSPSGLTVTPSAETVQSDPLWSTWVDGNYTHIDDDNARRGFESDQASVSFALDRYLTERILVGLLFNHSDSETRNVSVPGRSTTENHSPGAYIGVVLSDSIVFDASFLYTFTDNFAEDSVPVVQARYDSQAWALNANLTGHWYADSLRFSPTVGISYSRARDDAYVDSAATALPSVVTRTGTLTFGTTFGYTVALGEMATAEPYVSFEGEWTFEESTSPPRTSATTAPDTRDFDFRIAGGIEFALPHNMTLTLRGDVGGLARKRYRTISAGGQFAIAF